MTSIQKQLFDMQDLTYRDFSAKLMPNVEKDRVIGVRTPALRAFAKRMFKEGNYQEFLNDLPHTYYEENNLHGFLIEQIKDFDSCLKELDKFLPFVDNWATCDLMRPKAIKTNLPELLEKINVWIKSEKTYIVRFAIEMLMCYYLDSEFKKEYLEKVSYVKSDEYYVNMMISWYFATALAKHYDETVIYLENNRLPEWVHNKTIQKAIESYRITDEKKRYLKTLKKPY